MKSLLLTVTLFVLVAVLQAQDDLPFLSEENELSGVLFIKATVDQRNLAKKRRPVVMFPHRVTCPEQGTLEIRTTVMSEGQCIKAVFRIQRTEEPGQYTTFSGQMFYYIYKLPVKDHYIVYIENISLEKNFQRGLLIGRCPEENLEALEEFKNFTQRKGFLQENIIVPEQRGEKMLCSAPPFMSPLCHP
ncbi:vomeronasal secretory protein 2-like [Mesocricetus auratus]|uniref:Vomeronasal secretory protein 2-like n=1 Tax=Mesocricetus auratus TaxID=10036 RepID=A0A1U8CGY5_MESAU|nr:vomeronasal secretory protein 2-like [Mesocricetus auratus]